MILQKRFLTETQLLYLSNNRFAYNYDIGAIEIPENERLTPELHEIIVQYNQRLSEHQNGPTQFHDKVYNSLTEAGLKDAEKYITSAPQGPIKRGPTNTHSDMLIVDDPKSAWAYDKDAFKKWADKYCTPQSYPFKSNLENKKMSWNTDDRKNRERIQTLHPLLRKKAMAHLRALDDKNIRCRITHGERTFAEQDAIYALGRTKPGKIVTTAKGGDSWHNYCLAYDVVLLTFNPKGELIANWDTELPAWDTIIECGKAAGMTHGIKVSGWVDVPHFQDTIGIKNIAEAKALWKRGILHSWVGVA